MAIRMYPFIDQAVSRLRLRKSIASEATTTDDSFTKPFITVAREPGSGGAPIAERVAEQLGFELIDKQLVVEVAKSTRSRNRVIKSIDEKGRGLIEDMVHSVLNPEYVGEEEYVSSLFETILAYSCKGNVVILGRGSNFITPFARGLHVSITAPYEVRVQRAMDFEGHSRENAKAVIAKVEKERSDFVKKYVLSDVTRRNAYDLTINTMYFQVEEATEIIVQAFKQKFPRTFGL